MPHPSSRAARRLLLPLLAVAAVVLPGCRYRVALYGDVPYTESAVPAYERMIDDINEGGVAFSVHVGDFKAGSAPCTDANLLRNVLWFDSFTRPLVFTPGDNDWTDCADPAARLRRLREVVYRYDGRRSRGAEPMALLSQVTTSKPENARWSYGPVTFATIHVVGDGNGTGAERTDRTEAAIRWLRAAFAHAEANGHAGVVIAGHADLRFQSAEGAKGAYESLFRELRTLTRSFEGQVLYVHGDGHTFIDDRPMKTSGGAPVQNFRRVQVHGSPDVRWVRLTVDTETSGVFHIAVPPAP